MGIFRGPDSVADIRAYVTLEAAYLSEFLIEYAAAMQYGMDQERVDRATRAMEKSNNAGDKAAALMEDFAPACG